MDLKQLTRKVKVESTKLKKQLDGAPAKLKKTFDAEVKRLETTPAKLKKQLGATPARFKRQLDAEVKKLESASGRLAKQLEALPARAAEAVGIVSATQLKSLRSELTKLSKRVDQLSKQPAA